MNTKTAIKLLEKASRKIESVIEHRKNVFDNRTDKWKDSFKSEIYIDETEAIELIESRLNSLIFESKQLW